MAAYEEPERYSSSGPRRAGLQQRRSQETRRKLVRAALALWNERGFERGIEETTAEEIARAAGVTKGTFYFHFAHKEDILLEIGWATAESMIVEAEAAMTRGRSTREIIHATLASLAKRVENAPRPAVIRANTEFARRRHVPNPEPAKRRPGFQRTFHDVVEYGQRRGEIPPAADADDVAALLQAVTMDTLGRWAVSERSRPGALRLALQRHADVVIGGVEVVWPWSEAPALTSDRRR
jgi:AcrR family transcriptional regulator